jgi:hypothetical protein
MRRILVLSAVVAVGLLGVLPPVGAEDFAPPEAGGGDTASTQPGFFGFQQLTTVAQGQIATGYFFAIGDEVNRLVGARSEIDGPPVNSRTVAAFIQRGIGATYVYGVAGGPGGTSGALPDPPPGEAPGYFPTTPHETTFSGPLTATINGGQARTVDGRFHSKAEEGAAGSADAAVIHFDVPSYFTVEEAVASSRGTPVAAGVEAESVSVLRGLTVGPVHIDSLTSRAYGFVPSIPGDPKGEATTIVEGATVGKVPVHITDHGIVVADKSDPSAAKAVRDALKGAGLSDVRLLNSLTAPSDDHQHVQAQAGGLAVIHKDPEFGAKNPQGFQGGGFALGGAEVSVTGQRCEPACAGFPQSSEAPGLSFDSPKPVESSPQPSGAPESSALSAAPAFEDNAAAAFDPATSVTDVAADPAVTFSHAVTPSPSPSTAPGPTTPTRRFVPATPTTAGRAPLRAALAAANAMGDHDARDLERLFLALGGALVVLVAARALTRARWRQEESR